MPKQDAPNDPSSKSKAEGERWKSDSETVERYDDEGGGSLVSEKEQRGGITNRPLVEEIENQAAVPDRGKSREGAHAGHGDAGTRHDNDETDIERSDR